MEERKEYDHILTPKNAMSIAETVELKIPVPWGHIAGKAWGDPCGQPVLCVHGIQDNAGTFDHLIPLLPRIFHYVSIDLPGHGLSSHFPAGVPLNFMNYVYSLVRVLNHLQWEDCCYMSHSLGSQLGIYLAALWPERIKKLILIDSLAPMYVSPNEFLPFNRRLLDVIMTNEEKFANNKSPTYTYSEALDRLISNRRSLITEDAGRTMLIRSLVKNEDGSYSFSTDQRLKIGLRPMVTSKQQLQILNALQCPILLLASDIQALENWRPMKAAYEVYNKKQNFQRFNVDGNHDVHINSPEKIASHITKFLMNQKSSL
ncbi:serine hydrolase-like protein isoform X1 [Periplaneta americana]|uniref:serine hydrolase-like protein isoform X1 n=1 Tax=Periplaneta americana TaxID=6978 RepID=UPI0037E7263A